MKIKVLYFAALRDAAGRGEEVLDCEAGTTPEALWRGLQARYPPLAVLPYSPRPAVNAAFSSWERALCEGDEVTFLAPMSGG